MTTKMYTLTEDYLGYTAGTTLYRCKGYHYGCKEDDEWAFGEECLNLTAEADGSYPFVIVPASKVADAQAPDARPAGSDPERHN